MSLKQRAVIASLKVLPQHWMSHCAGLVASIRWPQPLCAFVVRAFGRFFGVNFEEVRAPIASFPSVQSFFTRELKEGVRPIDMAADAFVSPCDGAWGESGIITAGTALQVKGRSYSVARLLGDDGADHRFEGGVFLTLYLSPRDYHRFHAPCAGAVADARSIAGALWPVNAAGIQFVDGLFTQNERVVARLRPTGTNGEVAMVAVGATMVGKVRVTFDATLTTNDAKVPVDRHYEPAISLDKAQQWGHFEFGSTLVLVATRGLITLDAASPGTPVKLGARIGTLHQ